MAAPMSPTETPSATVPIAAASASAEARINFCQRPSVDKSTEAAVSAM
jgi:hypothetical protein